MSDAIDRARKSLDQALEINGKLLEHFQGSEERAEAERELLESATFMLAAAELLVPYELRHAKVHLREAIRRYRETR